MDNDCLTSSTHGYLLVVELLHPLEVGRKVLRINVANHRRAECTRSDLTWSVHRSLDTDMPMVEVSITFALGVVAIELELQHTLVEALDEVLELSIGKRLQS